MEEGPEPQELMEQIEQSHKNKEHIDEAKHAREKAFVVRSAITASALAVGAALSSLLSGHAANDAIIKKTEASDKWSYYQAKSTKSHVYEGNKEVIIEMAALLGKSDDAKVHDTLASFDSKMKKFEQDKAEIQKEAQSTEKESTLCFSKHQSYSFAVACFQIGIVLASVAILADANWLYWTSVGAGVVGLIYIYLGWFKQ